MIDEWLHNINYRKLVGCITLDFKKAFDILSHDLINRSEKQIPNSSNKSSLEHIKYGGTIGFDFRPFDFYIVHK